MRQVILICVGLLLGTARVAHADTAGEIASYCEPYRSAVIVNVNPDGSSIINVPNADVNSNYCWGAFATFQELSVLRLTGQTTPALRVCTPPKSDRLELVKVFIRFMDEHPEKRHEDFGPVLLEAMWRAYPCGKSK